MTKIEAWQAWCVRAGTEDLATEFTLAQSSHGKAFSFAWDAAVQAEREECAKVCEAEGQRIDASWSSCATAIRSRT